MMPGARLLVARFTKFGLVGILGAVLQALLFALLSSSVHLPGAWAALVAVEIVVLHNFLWHERFTWRDRKTSGFRQKIIRLARFHAMNGAVSLAGNIFLAWLLIERLKAPALPSELAAIALCAPANFLAADAWVYRPPLRPNMLNPKQIAPKSL